jgi:signal transduction histidine kinase/CheY-like chemotaxis protein
MSQDAALLRAQAGHLHRNIPTGIVGGYVVACLLCSAFIAVADNLQMALWLLAGAVLGAWRLTVWYQHRGTEFTPERARRWLREVTLGAGLSGLIWAAGPLIFFAPHEFLYHLLYVYAVAMMGVTAMFSFTPYAPTFMAYFLPTTVPAVLGMAVQGSWLHFEVSLGVAIFIAVTLRFFSTFNRMFIRSVQLGFENQVLVDELTVQKEAAESANLAKSRFLAAASHDLRQPMHALTLYLAAMEGSDLRGTAPANLADARDSARTNLAAARQCAQTMDEMFRALLDISRLDAGAVSAEPRAFTVAHLLERIRMEFEPQARARGLRLTVRPCTRVVMSDPELLERILRNLVSNAVRYTERGRILVGCRMRRDALRGPRLRIVVADTGLGIAAGEQRQIFEEFYQTANPERDRGKGIGLGLAIVDRLARLLESRVDLRSVPKRGSVFSFDLPLAQDAMVTLLPVSRQGLEHKRSEISRDISRNLAARLNGLFIVVVDDEQTILAATREVLEKWHCKVVTASSGADALEQLANSGPPDALICDYRLRNHETGIDVIEALRAEFNTDIPALLVSGDSAPARMREAEANGLRVLHKPFNESSLRKAMGDILAATLTGAPEAAGASAEGMQEGTQENARKDARENA